MAAVSPPSLRLRYAEVGRPVSARLFNDLVDAVKALHPRAGDGIEISEAPGGVAISLARHRDPVLVPARIVERIGPAEGSAPEISYTAVRSGLGNDAAVLFGPGDIFNRAHMSPDVLIVAALPGDRAIIVHDWGLEGGRRAYLLPLTEQIKVKTCSESAGDSAALSAEEVALVRAMLAGPLEPEPDPEEAEEMVRTESPQEFIVDAGDTDWKRTIDLSRCDEFTVDVIDVNGGAIDATFTVEVRLSADGLTPRSGSALATLNSTGSPLSSGALDPAGAAFALLEITAATAASAPRDVRIVVNRRRTS